MSAKQDGVAPRTANDIEQRYNFRRSFAEVMGVANDARTAAEKAMTTADGTYSEFIRLSDSISMNVVGGVGGKASITLKVGEKEYSGEIDLQGLVTFTNLSTAGQTVINGENISTGVISSEDGSVQIDLRNNNVSVTTIVNGLKGKIVIDHEGITGYGYDEGGTETYYKTLKIDPGGVYGGNEYPTVISSLDSNAGISIYAGKSNTFTVLGSRNGPTVIEGSLIAMNGKTTSWRDNGDGTYTLIGTPIET